MSGIGPELPPHLLAKRKRQNEERAQDPTTTASGAKPSEPESAEKRRRVVGPVMPPAPLDERPTESSRVPDKGSRSSDSDDSDDDDGYGPALPSASTATATDRKNGATDGTGSSAPIVEERVQRDEWMMMPPKQDDLAARMDPTKIRARGFNTGKGAKAPNTSGAEDNSIWHETPEQKRKRLEDEMMGVAKSTTGPLPPSKSGKKSAQDEASARLIQEHTKKTRGTSLVEQHKVNKGEEAEDDPSKRAFDREKDMGNASRISGSQRREMLNKTAGGFASKFSGGGYL